jgi:hypothetical protein
MNKQEGLSVARHQWLICNPSYLGGSDQKDHIWSYPQKIICETLSQKYSTQKGLAEWFKWYLPSKCEAQSSNPSITKKFF